jgi:hypothetical protein
MKHSNEQMNRQKGLWAKLAVNYYDNPKFDDVSPLAELLYVRSIAFAKTENTGVLSLKAAARIAFDLGEHDVLSNELLDAGLWSRVDDGVMITNWHEWQEDADRVEAKREQGRFNAHKRHHAEKSDASCSYCNEVGSLNGSPTTNPMEEKRREESEKINTLPDFDLFWDAYPRKVGKGDARKAWLSSAKTRPTIDALLLCVENAKREWLKNEQRFIPHPATWIRQERWSDEAASVAPVSVRKDMTLANLEGDVVVMFRLHRSDEDVWDYINGKDEKYHDSLHLFYDQLLSGEAKVTR